MRNYRKCKAKVQWVVIHHTDIPDDYSDVLTMDILDRETKAFNAKHGTKFECLYHYVVLPSGQLKKYEDVGYYLPHCGLNFGEGRITNDNSVSVALSGKLSEQLPKDIILDVAANEVAYLTNEYKLIGYTYHDFVLKQVGSGTECPGLLFPYGEFETLVKNKMEGKQEPMPEPEPIREPWWKDLKTWGIEKGILTGDEYGNIDMNKEVTLAEVMAIIYKYDKARNGGK
jgi:hypothetical protein